MAFVLLLVGVAAIALGCVLIANGATGATLVMGIAMLVLGAGIILSVARTGGGGKHR